MCSKYVGLCAQNSRLNKIQNCHFDNVQEIHTSSENYEEHGFRHNLGLPIILH